MPIPCQRHLFDIPDDVTYLNCAYISPSLRSVTQAGREGVHRKAQPWRITAPAFFDESERARALFARISGATADDIAIIPAVSYGVAVAARNLETPSGSNIVVLAEQFPSNYYAWYELSRERGAQLVTVRHPPDGEWTEAILSRINEETAVVAVSNCHWTDGSFIDLQAVSRGCREVDAALVIDGAQSLGAIPFSVKDVQPDFLITPSYKWLLGPYSLGFMYIAPQHLDSQPLEHNWIHRADSDDFAALLDYRDEFQPGARKFDVGERSNFALMPMAVAALGQILEWEVSEIAARLSGMTETISQRGEAMGLSVAPSELRAGHLIGLRCSEGLPPDLSERLAEDKVYVSIRGDSVRVSPHLYNAEEDIDRLFDVLAAVL